MHELMESIHALMKSIHALLKSIHALLECIDALLRFTTELMSYNFDYTGAHDRPRDARSRRLAEAARAAAAARSAQRGARRGGRADRRVHATVGGDRKQSGDASAGQRIDGADPLGSPQVPRSWHVADGNRASPQHHRLPAAHERARALVADVARRARAKNRPRALRYDSIVTQWRAGATAGGSSDDRAIVGTAAPCRTPGAGAE